MLMPTMNYTVAATTPNTAEVEMCRTVSSSQYNVDQPFSRNTYIEQGMDVFLVSSIFDTLIQRPEPVRKTAIGTTEQGRTQNFPGSGYFAGGVTTLFETDMVVTTVMDAEGLVKTVTCNAGSFAGQVAVGDIIYIAAPAALTTVAMQNEAFLVTGMTSDRILTIERGFLDTDSALTVNTDVVYVRRTNGAFPGGISSPSAVSPLPEVRTVGQGIHSGGDSVAANKVWQRNDQLLGNIQTTGTRYPRGGPPTAAFADVTTGIQKYGVSGANARGMNFDSAISMETHNYGFDSDFRLYSVLGPFMRPAIIRDVVDTSKMSKSVLSSRFPGVQTINAYDSPRDLIATNTLVNTGGGGFGKHCLAACG
jgi:hypothetical protein